MIPICLVTGFLGSGKTSFLRHTAQRLAGKPVAFIVNEFANVDIDSQLLGPGVDTLAIPGGSIYCRCKVTEFIDHLQQLEQRHRQSPLQGVVIEATGMADPSVVTDLLAETRLDQTFALAQVICLVDPFTLPRLVRTLPNLKRQVLTADLVLINKTDLADSEKIETAQRLVHDIKPDAQVITTTHGRFDLELFAAHDAPRGRGKLAECRDPNFEVATLCEPQPIDPNMLRRGAESLGEKLYRVKGFINTPDGWRLVQGTAEKLDITPVTHHQGLSTLAWIVAGDSRDQLDRVIDSLRPRIQLNLGGSH